MKLPTRSVGHSAMAHATAALIAAASLNVGMLPANAVEEVEAGGFALPFSVPKVPDLSSVKVPDPALYAVISSTVGSPHPCASRSRRLARPPPW